MRRLIPLLLLVCVPLGACKNEASPATLPDGVTPISKNMRKIWNAPGGPGCRWTLLDSHKRVLDSGRSEYPDRVSQTVIIGTAAVGGQLRSDKCGGWK